MKDNWDDVIKLVIKEEGGFVNDKNDPGGMTNWGVTKKTLEDWCGHEVNEQAMRNLIPADVYPLYQQRFWDVIGGDICPRGLDYALMDFAVNSGPARALRYVQTILDVEVTGKLDDATKAALADCDGAETASKLCDNRLEYLQKLPTFDRYGKGWSARVGRVKSEAAKMAG